MWGSKGRGVLVGVSVGGGGWRWVLVEVGVGGGGWEENDWERI